MSVRMLAFASNPFYLILFVFFAINTTFTFNEIYRNSLFLSTYPGTWLPFLSIAVFVANILVFLFVAPLTKKYKYLNQILLILCILLGVVIALLTPLNLFWTPFVLNIYACVIPPIITAVCFDLTVRSFSTRQLKQYMPTFRAANSVAIILSAPAAPYLLQFFGEAFIFQLGLVALSCVAIVFIFLSRPLVFVPLTRHTPSIPLWRYPLLQQLLPTAICASGGYFVADYLLKIQLAAGYDRAQIADFYSYFIGMVNVAALLILLFISPIMINRYGFLKMLSVAPILIVMGAIILPFTHSLPLMAFYTGCLNLAYYSFYILAFDIALAALPSQVKISVKLIQVGILEPLGLLASALFFLLILQYQASQDAQIIAGMFFSATITIPWFYILSQFQKTYQSALQEVARLRRFTLNTLLIQDAHRENMALSLLRSPIAKLYPFGFYLLSNLNNLSKSTMDVLFDKARDSDEVVALQAWKCLENKDKALTTAFAIEQLKTESRESILQKLVDLLSESPSTEILPFIRKILEQEISSKQIYLIPVTMLIGDFVLIEKAIQILLIALTHTHEPIRTAAAVVLGQMPIGDPQLQLQQMLTDPVPTIALAAIKSSTKYKAISLIPYLARLLKKPSTAYAASNALQQFGEIALPEVIAIIHAKQKYSATYAAIATLTRLEGVRVEAAIVELGEHSTPMIKTEIAYQALLSATTIARSPAYKQNLHHFILHEAKCRAILKAALLIPFPLYIQREIQVQLHLASIRCLCWFGAYTDPVAVLPSIRTIRRINSNSNKNRINLILELFSALAKDVPLQQVFTTWDDNPILPPSEEEMLQLKKEDMYLEKLTNYYEQKGTFMDDVIQKLIVLREVNLFEKLSSDVMYVVAQEVQWREMVKNEVIFSKGDSPDGLYILVSGEVILSDEGKVLAKLKELDFFGEVGLINDEPRLATATAASDGMLLYMDQVTFDDLTNDFPDVLRAVTSVIISYLRKDRNGRTSSTYAPSKRISDER